MKFYLDKKRLIILFFLFSLFFYFWQGIFLPKDKNNISQKNFLIKKGESIKEIAYNLQQENLIKNKPLFYFYLLLKASYNKVQAGEYFISPSQSIAEITDKIISGEIAKERITIIEGWNLRDIGWNLENRGLVQAEELFELVGFPTIDYSQVEDLPSPEDFSEEFSFLKDKPKNVGLEGYLFPDTYDILLQEDIRTIVKKMLGNFDKKIKSDLRKEIVDQNKSIFEIITMASLLEREVKTVEEKKIVSGILWKRIKYNIPLQVDATITYITGKKTTKVSKEDTQINSRYNTYKYLGLPLGPISNPGLESIKAALYPKDSNFWYYLTVPGGKAKFSETLEEHNRKKYKYLK